MILTVTLNTSIDKAYIVDSLEVGKVQRVKEVFATAGGKGLNVARAVKSLGEDVIATGFVGGYSGEFIKSELDKEGIKHDFVDVDGETRTCINIIDKASGIQTELLEPGPFVSIYYKERFLSIYNCLLEKSKVITISGSVPSGLPTNIYNTLIEMAKLRGKNVILDSSGESLKVGINALPTIIKSNISEVENLLNMKITSVDDAKKAANIINSEGIEIVVISMGQHGAILSHNKKVYFANAPKVAVVNTVGSGDAMVAALAIAVSKEIGFKEMLRYSVAVASSSVMNVKTGYCREEDVIKNYYNVSVVEI